MLIFAVIIILAALAGIYIYKESTSLSVTDYTYTFDRLKADEFNFVMLSDLHGMDYGQDNRRLLELIDRISPDAVLLAGDMITTGHFCRYNSDEYRTTLSLIKELSTRYPVYYGIGNHEEKLRRYVSDGCDKWDGYTKDLSGYGIHILQNETVCLDKEGIVIYGLDLDHKYYRRFRDLPVPDGYLEGIFGEPDRDKVSILIAHFPDQFEAYAKWGADLVLSGHVHGGVIRLPFFGGVVSPQLKLFPKYDSGEFKLNRSTMILTRGAGTHTIPIRINNRPEIVHVKLKKG
ncbi:MAG: metallophosphoesterase [Lachnospiraceae bacterium]|nr:metallophosphoesterase [Lachnospiraceae bacterium]